MSKKTCQIKSTKEDLRIIVPWKTVREMLRPLRTGKKAGDRILRELLEQKLRERGKKTGRTSPGALCRTWPNCDCIARGRGGDCR